MSRTGGSRVLARARERAQERQAGEGVVQQASQRKPGLKVVVRRRRDHGWGVGSAVVTTARYVLHRHVVSNEISLEVRVSRTGTASQQQPRRGPRLPLQPRPPSAPRPVLLRAPGTCPARARRAAARHATTTRPPGDPYPKGALHLDAMNHARSTVSGSTADGMGAGRVVGCSGTRRRCRSGGCTDDTVGTMANGELSQRGHTETVHVNSPRRLVGQFDEGDHHIGSS